MAEEDTEVERGDNVVPRRPRVRFAKDYELRDVISLYRRREWTSWLEIVNWLRTEGPDIMNLTPGEVARMVADFSVLADEHTPFMPDPAIAYELAQAHRRTSAVLEALDWIERIRPTTR